jgi:hypothetical protein
MRRIDTIEREIAPLREQLKSHDLYYHLSGVEDIKVFMEKHVFAVWDFMSLLKALQRNLTCIDMPWKPSQNAKTARFINEIVLEEESDLNENGVPKSHFEMYLDAMKEVGANPDRILDFIRNIDSMQSLMDQLPYANLKKAEREFLEFTFKVIQTGQSHKIAAAFTFGREDVIPDMFIEIINKSSTSKQNQFPKLTYYLNRHIELDGDEHGPLALEMIAELCGEDEEKWQDVQSVSIQALEKRIQLWDEITAEIHQSK